MPISTEGMDVYHVYPIRDALEHETEGNRCWCKPEYDIRHDRMIVIHNDADLRAQWHTPEGSESVRALIQNAPLS